MATSLLDAISTGLQQRAQDQTYKANELALRTAQRQEEMRPVENRLAQIALGQRRGTAPGTPGMKAEPQDQQSALMELVALNPEMGMQIQQAGFKLAADQQTRAENQAKALSGFLQSLSGLPVEQRAQARDMFLQNPVAQAMVDNPIMAALAQQQDFSDAVIAPMVTGAGGQAEAPSYEFETTEDNRIVAIDRRDPTRVVDTGQRARPPREAMAPTVSYTVQPWVGADGEVVPVRISNRTGMPEVLETPDGLRPAPKSQGADVARLRNEYLRETKDYGLQVQAMNRIAAASRDSTGAQDIALVFSFMKMLDPTSVVREGEFATAANSGGIPDRIVNIYNKVLSGQFLTPKQRQDFVNAAQSQLTAARQSASQVEQEYRRIAESMNIDPATVIVNREAGTQPPPQARPAPGQSAAPRVNWNNLPQRGQ